MKPYAQYIGSTDGVHHLTAANGDTKDIMNTVMLADGKAAAYCAQLAKALTGADQVQTCYNIWNFWKQNVKYVEDPDGYQFIKSPAYLYETGTGDCKSFSVAVGSCLKHLGIPYAYRFITQEANKPFHHVYVVAYTNQGAVLIDCVIDYFNKENAYARKKDVSPTRTSAPMPKAAAIGRANRGVHYLPNTIGATQAEIYNNSWLAFDKQFADNVKGNNGFYQQCKAAGYADIENDTQGHPLKRAKIKKAWTDNFDQFVTSAELLMYLHWDLSKAPGNYVIDLGNGTTVEINQKRQKGGEFRDALMDLGIRTGTLTMLAQLGCYNAYGITLEHMLDRCYNMVNYGQPWKPAPGVPYFNFRTGTWVNQGTTAESLQQILRIIACCPAAGGITRPFGQPYISLGGWYIQNGATDAVFSKYQKEYVLSQYEKDRILIKGGVDPAQFAKCWQDYQLWISGNMPALPAAEVIVTNKGKRFGIGRVKSKIGELGITAIVGIVVACITAVIAVVKLIMELVNKTHVTPDPRYIPNPPQDFHMEYQTVDGCYIGTAPQECGSGKAKYCPDGSFICLTAADLAKPENQAGTPAGGFLNLGSSTGLLLLLSGVLLYFGLTGSKSNA